MGRHLRDHGFGEQAWLARHTDKDGWLHVADHIEERRWLINIRPVRNDRRISGECTLDALEVGVGHEQAPAIEDEDAGIGALGCLSVHHHGVLDLLGDSVTGRSRPCNDNTVAAVLRSEFADGRQDACDHHGCGSLNVVVERGDPCAVLREVVEARAVSEVLPLQQRIRIHLDDSVDELVDEAVVLLATKPRLAVSDVELIVEQFCVVGADIQRDGDATLRMDSRRCCVQRKLPDGYPHTTSTLIANAEDAFVVGHHNDRRLHHGACTENVGNPASVPGSDVDATLPSVDPRPVRTCKRDGRRVDDGDRVCQVVRDEPIEERFIAIHQAVQVNVLSDIGRLEVVLDSDPSHLAFEEGDLVRQEPGEAESLSLVPGKGVPLVQKRVAQDRLTPSANSHVGLAGFRIGSDVE